jgi:Amt family ammonium transporter
MGYASSQVGSVNKKNTQNILLKNVLDASLGAVFFAAVGYGLAYGDTSGHGFLHRIVGKDHFFLQKEDFEDGSGYGYASWLFQWAFAATTATIVSGAVAERCTVIAHMAYASCLMCVIYPVVVCCVWNAEGLASAWRTEDKLFGCGVLDFAGSGVVHMTGGVAAFVGATLIGPRRAYLVNELSLPTYGPIFQTLGVLILWFGWFGFNGVSTLYLIGYAEVAAKTMVVTTIAAGVGALAT